MQYRKGGVPKVCEIDAGVDNMMAVIDRLIFSGEGGTPPGLPSGSLRGAADRASKLDLLCKLFSREGKPLSWRVQGAAAAPESEEQSRKSLNAGNVGVDVAFQIEGSPAFTWTFNSMHFAVKANHSEKVSWKDQVCLELVKHDAKKAHSLLPWFSSQKLLDQLPSDIQREELIYALPLSSVDERLAGFRAVVTSPKTQAMKMKRFAEKVRAGIHEETDLNRKQQIHIALADGDYPFGDPAHALGKPDAVYTRVDPEKLAAAYGAETAKKMGKSWARKMYGHSIAIGEPLLSSDGTELKVPFEKAKEECIKLNPVEKRQEVATAMNQRESLLDAIRKSGESDSIQKQKLAEAHKTHPIPGCYLMSREEWQIPQEDFVSTATLSQYVPQFLRKLNNRWFWSSSGRPIFSYDAYVFNGYDGSVYDGNRNYGSGVRCSCAAAWITR